MRVGNIRGERNNRFNIPLPLNLKRAKANAAGMLKAAEMGITYITIERLNRKDRAISGCLIRLIYHLIESPGGQKMNRVSRLNE
jgi:hypothetical protein